MADHDLDDPNQGQINIFAGRGILIESQGPTWLWGTAAEHAILYNYGLSSAQNIVMGLVQTEAPYFQPMVEAPAPFQNSLFFADDPTFSDCTNPSLRYCFMSWAVHMVDSSAVYILSTGLYSWFNNYSQVCITDGRKDCQYRNFFIEQSYDVWVYNLISIGNLQMLSPWNQTAILGSDNRNGYASSILAWMGGANQTAGQRVFPGYQLYSLDNLTNTAFPPACQTALTATIQCDAYTSQWIQPSYHGALGNATLQASVCNAGCGSSLASWYSSVQTNCAGYTWNDGSPVDMFGGYIWYGYNETCSKDPATGLWCNDVISNFTL